MVCRRKVVSTEASNLGWGVLCDVKPAFGMIGPSHLSARPEGTSRLSQFGQYDGGVLHKSLRAASAFILDLFASEDNTHCLTYFSKDWDALAHDWPNLALYAFPPIALIPQVIRWSREQKHRVLLVALPWRNQHWFSELARLLTAAPWPIPLRRDLLSHANGTIWHLQLDLWASVEVSWGAFANARII